MTASNILMYKDMLILGVLSKEFINSAFAESIFSRFAKALTSEAGGVSREENSPVDCFSGERPAMDGRAGCGSKDGCMQPVSRAQGTTHGSAQILNSTEISNGCTKPDMTRNEHGIALPLTGPASD